MLYLTAPDTKNATTVYRYMVQLLSRECEIQDGYAVPLYEQTIDVLVTDDSLQTIERLLSDRGILKKWFVVDYWQAVDESTDNTDVVPF